MKVVYRKPIDEKVLDAIREANELGKEIEKIVLTKAEWREWDSLGPFRQPSFFYGLDGPERLYYGIPIEVES